MIQRFVDRFIAAKAGTIAGLLSSRPDDYDGLVRRLLKVLSDTEDADWEDTPDPERLTVIDHGDYQGTRLYIVGATGYQPSTYWSIFVNYGSCSGCDTFQATCRYSDDLSPDDAEAEAKGFWTMMLHMVQSMRSLTAEAAA